MSCSFHVVVMSWWQCWICGVPSQLLVTDFKNRVEVENRYAERCASESGQTAPNIRNI